MGEDMAGHIGTEAFKKELFDLLEETFESVQGIFLDRGTSFFETLESISADKASRPVSETCPSIAAQVEHTRFYLQVLLEGCLQSKPIDKVDWEESWKLKEVTAAEWNTLKEELRKTHRNVLKAMKDLSAWEGEDDIGASLAILAHTAYHLGAVRQALCVLDRTANRAW
jgi:hypothetical protein